MKPFTFMVMGHTMPLTGLQFLGRILVVAAGYRKTNRTSTKLCHLSGLQLSNVLAVHKSYGLIRHLIRV